MYNGEDQPSLDMIRRADLLRPAGRLRELAAHRHGDPLGVSGADGFKLWDEWSRTDAARYQGRRAGEEVEELQAETGGVTIGTVFGMAKVFGFDEWGYDIERRLEGVSESSSSRRVSPLLKGSPKPPRPKFTLDEDFVMAAPGTVGRLTRWIVETAIQPQPVLASPHQSPPSAR